MPQKPLPAERNGVFSLSDSTPEQMLKRLREAEDSIRTQLLSHEGQQQAETSPLQRNETLELSVILPCFNDVETIGDAIEQVKKVMCDHRMDGEIIVADNGSSDGSIQVANDLGVRVVHIRDKGYGNAVMGGVEASRGKYVILGNVNGNYDYQELPSFLEKLREGREYVQGSRLARAGGKIVPGAMSRWQRWLGRPLYSFFVRRMFRTSLRDVGCGFRGFTRELYDRLGLQSSGPEFSVELVIKASKKGTELAEVPVKFHPQKSPSKKRYFPTFRDGWRTFRFFLMYSPRWVFLVPAIVLCLASLTGYALALPGTNLYGIMLDTHALLVASLAGLLGFQLLQFIVFAKTFAVGEGFFKDQGGLGRIIVGLNLERCLLIGALTFLAGIALVGGAFSQWSAIRFGVLDHPITMRWLITGATLTVLGFQAILGSLFVSILRLRWKK